MKNKPLIEHAYGHGAIRANFFKHWFRKATQKSLIKGLGFDWSKGFDVRDTIGSIEIKNQGSNSSCGGQSGSYFLEIQRRLQAIKEGACSAKSIYSPISYAGGGTTLIALQGQIKGSGANLEAVVPSMVNGLPMIEAQITDKSWRTSALTEDALTRGGYVPYDIGTNIDDVATAIQNYGACIIEISGQNGHNPGWLSAYPCPPLPNNGQEIWNHFLCCCGAKIINGVKYAIALESMGTSVGENGIQYISEAYFQSGFVREAFTFMWDGNIYTPVKRPQSDWAYLADWFAGWFGLDKWLGYIKGLLGGMNTAPQAS